MVIRNCQFFNENTAIKDQIGMEWMIDSATFDDHKSNAIILNGLNSAGNHLNISHSHFETNGIPLAQYGFITNQSSTQVGTPIINIQDTTFLVDVASPSATALIDTTSKTIQLNVVGGYVESAQSTYFVDTAASVWIQSVAGNALGNLTGKIIKVSPHPSLVTNVFGGSFNAPQ